MMGYERTSQYNIRIIENQVADIANYERQVPDEYISPDGNDVTEACLEYLRPLIIGETRLIIEDGLPKHIALNN